VDARSTGKITQNGINPSKKGGKNMGLLKLFSARFYWVIFFMFVFLFTLNAVAQNKVVVGSAFGYEQQTLNTPVPVEKTGQTTSYATGDDGGLQKGVAWPNPRFTDNKDGTVTDNLTGLIWLKNANCFGQRTWAGALADCNNLADKQCGLTDSSSPGDWRLPNIKELQSLIHYGVFDPALCNAAGTGQWSEGDPFTDVQSSYYWSSTTHASSTDDSWLVQLNLGEVYYLYKSYNYYVWPVRSGK
jgi:hypothetical protein